MDPRRLANSMKPQKHACKMARESDEARVIATGRTAELDNSCWLCHVGMDEPDGHVSEATGLARMAKDGRDLQPPAETEVDEVRR